MQWSKTKSTLESFICDKLKGRVKLYATVYRKSHDGPSRVWITCDKKEILSASDVAYGLKHNNLFKEIIVEEQLNGIPNYPDWKVMFYSKERKALVNASDKAEEMMINQGVFESYHLYGSFMKYNNLSIDEAINSENMIIRVFAMFDRRIGKRRLQEINFAKNTHPLVIKFYKIRCDAEGIY